MPTSRLVCDQTIGCHRMSKLTHKIKHCICCDSAVEIVSDTLNLIFFLIQGPCFNFLVSLLCFFFWTTLNIAIKF